MRNHFLLTTGRQRLAYGIVVGAAIFLLPLPLSVASQALLAWSCGAMAHLVLSWLMALHTDAAATRAHAQSQDQPGVTLFVLLVLSVFASLAAIALMLQHVKDLSGPERLGHLALSLLGLASSWLLMQAIFAFRYAHLYYQGNLSAHPKGFGLEFPGKEAPDYYDFLYYAHVVGMTSQVSDVVVSSRGMRHLTLLHSISAFAFNMLVLALSINVMAGAIQ